MNEEKFRYLIIGGFPSNENNNLDVLDIIDDAKDEKDAFDKFLKNYDQGNYPCDIKDLEDGLVKIFKSSTNKEFSIVPHIYGEEE